MKHFNFFILGLCVQQVFAQQNFTLYPMQRIPQAHLINPAQTPDCNWHLGIPALNSTYLQYSNGGFNLNQIYKATETGYGDTVYLNLNKVLDLLSEKNYIALKAEFSLLSGGFKTGNHYFHFSAIEKTSVRISIPRDLFRFIIDGNGGENLGETFQFRFKADAIHYREYAAGYTYNLDDKIQLGGRLKILKGFNVLNTERANLNFTTNQEDYSYLLTSDISIRSASTYTKLLPSDTTGVNFNFRNHLTGSSNTGIALDLGASIQLNDKIRLSASILDLGYIRWNKNATGLKSRNPEASYRFDGIHISGKDTQVDFGQYMEDVADSLKQIFRLDTVEQAFNTGLSTEFFIGAQYGFTDKLIGGALFYGDFYNRRFYPGLTLNLLWKAGKAFELNFTNTFFNRGFLNPGIGAAWNMGPFQIYAVMDNCMLPFALSSVKSFSLRFGMNLTFGRNDSGNEAKDKHDKDEAIPDTTPESR